MKRIFVLLIVIGLSACGLDDTADCNDSLFDAMRLTAPPSAEFSEERCRSGLNPDYRAVFTLSPNDLETLQDSTPITDWETDASAASIFDEEAANLDSLIVGSHGDGAYLTEVLIDTGAPDLYTVYYTRIFVD